MAQVTALQAWAFHTLLRVVRAPLWEQSLRSPYTCNSCGRIPSHAIVFWLIRFLDHKSRRVEFIPVLPLLLQSLIFLVNPLIIIDYNL